MNDVLMAFQHDLAMLEVIKDNQKSKTNGNQVYLFGVVESFDSWEHLANMIDNDPDLIEGNIFAMRYSQRNEFNPIMCALQRVGLLLTGHSAFIADSTQSAKIFKTC